MKRHVITPRCNWEQKVENLGLTFHTLGNQTYWDESVCYSFTSEEINEIEFAANDVFEKCIKAAEHVLTNKLFSKLAIPEKAIDKIIKSWDQDDFSLYGRFDFLMVDGVPKMLEFNADTPTSLVEAAVIQWYWLEDTHKGKDQFNSIHDKLVHAWQKCRTYYDSDTVHFVSVNGHLEDEQTVFYLEDTCHQAGFKTERLFVDQIGWRNNRLVDLEDEPIEILFKLYPWEWLIHEDKDNYLSKSDTLFIEPAWKMLLSNKGILPILTELFPDCPYLLPAYFTELEAKYAGNGNWVEKPLLSREGNNVKVVANNQVVEKTDGEYGLEGYIYQVNPNVPPVDGKFFPVIGAWIVGGSACGMGIREDIKRISGDTTRFVPHYFE